jgi:transcription-repair coupling factor (superfamily II helicase)
MIEKEPDVKQALGVDGYIPQQFETKDFEKLSLYQRIEQIQNAHELKLLQEETQDLYGKLPKSVKLLFEKRRWDLLLEDPHIKGYKETKVNVSISFDEGYSSKIDGVKFFEKVSQRSNLIQLKYVSNSIILIFPKENDWLILANDVLEDIKALDFKGVKHAH